MAKSYIALIHPPEADGGSWGVTFPDLPGCTSAGDSFEEATENSREALAGHVAAMLADGDTVPEPSSYARLAAGDVEFVADQDAGAKAVPVPLVEIAAPRERINIMIDRRVLRRVDEVARAEGVSRSAFIEQTMEDRLPSHISFGEDPAETRKRNIIRRR